MKDNFLLKRNQKEVFDELTDEEAGRLIKGIFSYVSTGESNLKGSLKAVFIPIKNDIDRNEEKYQRIVERNRENGKLGGRPKKDNDSEETQKTQSVILETQENPKEPDTCHISYITTHISNINNHNSNNNLDIIKDIINYLNLKTNSKYKYTTKSTQQKINARLNEGYILDDFIAVIDKKYNEWIGTEFERYMNPETLFGTKFEKYLNQKTTRSKKTLKDISMSDLDRAIEIEKQRSGIS